MNEHIPASTCTNCDEPLPLVGNTQYSIGGMPVCARCFVSSKTVLPLVAKCETCGNMLTPVRWTSFDGDSESQSYTSEEYAQL